MRLLSKNVQNLNDHKLLKDSVNDEMYIENHQEAEKCYEFFMHPSFIAENPQTAQYSYVFHVIL